MPSGNPPQRTAEDRERARIERERRRQRANGSRSVVPPTEAPLTDPGPVDELDPSTDLVQNGVPEALSGPASFGEPERAAESNQVAAPKPLAEPADSEVLAEPEAPPVLERHAEPGVPPVAEPGVPPVAEPGVPPVAEPGVPPVAEPGVPSIAEPGVPSIAEPEPRPIAVKLPSPAPLPPRIAPPQPLRARRGHRPARIWVIALLGLVFAALVAVLLIVLLGHSHEAPRSHAAPVAVVRVTVPEGETRVQIAHIAAAKGLRGSYLQATRRSALLNPVRYGAPHTTHNLEGFLFPATYEVYAGEPAARLAAEQLAAFRENFGSEQALRAHALHVTPYQLRIVASMVEREALLERDRPRVAAVIYNRLHRDMPLGIDSTIRYALHDYTKPLTEAQLQTSSPYNTRLHTGLPPTPISNPGLASIDAAAHPAHVSYLYYVNGADGCGDLVFSTSEAQFEHNAAAYRESLARHGGRVPKCTKR
jgi:peptidoglycan lytic transglycosylase G